MVNAIAQIQADYKKGDYKDMATTIANAGMSELESMKTLKNGPELIKDILQHIGMEGSKAGKETGPDCTEKEMLYKNAYKKMQIASSGTDLQKFSYSIKEEVHNYETATTDAQRNDLRGKLYLTINKISDKDLQAFAKTEIEGGTGFLKELKEVLDKEGTRAGSGNVAKGMDATPLTGSNVVINGKDIQEIANKVEAATTTVLLSQNDVKSHGHNVGSKGSPGHSNKSLSPKPGLDGGHGGPGGSH